MAIKWAGLRGRKGDTDAANNEKNASSTSSDIEGQTQNRPKWALGILSDRETDEVPGSVLLMSKASEYNEPLGLENAPARTSSSSLPSPYLSPARRTRPVVEEQKRTADGAIILFPQPEDSMNDPLNWKVWRRDAALLSLGLYSLIGGGMTPVLAAGFNDVAVDYGISVPRVALSTGLYMMGLGVGCALLSPTAILWGKRPVYLAAAIGFILTSIWCGLSPNFTSLLVARVFQGIAVSSVECLPSASVAEIYFLHEKAYRLGIYTLLLLGGKNLVPLVSAVIIESLGWRWVFYIVAMVVGFCTVLLFFFVPETFWDRTPRPKHHNLSRRGSKTTISRMSSFIHSPTATRKKSKPDIAIDQTLDQPEAGTLAGRRAATRHAHFADAEEQAAETTTTQQPSEGEQINEINEKAASKEDMTAQNTEANRTDVTTPLPAVHTPPRRHSGEGYFDPSTPTPGTPNAGTPTPPRLPRVSTPHVSFGPETPHLYTSDLRRQPPRTFRQQLAPYSGRINSDKWYRVFLRPFILFAYPSILWSTLVYSLSIGWLIVLSESVSTIYKSRNTYNFNSLQAGLVYLSPFIGGVLGTAVAGKLSDVVVRAMSRRNGGVYEPEFRLVMTVPIAITTVIGLMGYGWSVEEKDAWIVPTVFFGFISFGCSLGSTTAITFAVDSYRQYAGEALVTLNFSKNIFHGLVFSLFFNEWLESDGSKRVFVAIGGIQLALLLTTIPMYIWGKRARMWTVRKNLMEKF